MYETTQQTDKMRRMRKFLANCLCAHPWPGNLPASRFKTTPKSKDPALFSRHRVFFILFRSRLGQQLLFPARTIPSATSCRAHVVGILWFGCFCLNRPRIFTNNRINGRKFEYSWPYSWMVCARFKTTPKSKDPATLFQDAGSSSFPFALPWDSRLLFPARTIPSATSCRAHNR
jgi:hypothetical protein